MLQLYAHHVPNSVTEEGRLEYHMTQLKAYALTSDGEACVQGITALRNTRDLVKREREIFIRAANTKVVQPASNRNTGELDVNHEFLVSTVHDGDAAWKGPHDDLQRQISDF